MKNFPEKIAPYLPFLGIICLIAGGALFFINRSFDLLTNVTLALAALFFLLYALVNPDQLRQQLSGRQVNYGASTVLSILFVVAIFALLQFVAYQQRDTWRIDATETNEFTPLPETIEILQGLDEPIHVIGFFTIQGAFQQQEARTNLESMQTFSEGNLTYEFVDPEVNPILAEQYDLSFSNTLVFTKGSGENEVTSKASAPFNDRNLHTALLQVINPVDKKAYFIAGHGERDSLDGGPEGVSTAVTLLEEAGFETEVLNLITISEIPEDATVLVLIDQQAPFTEAEFDVVKTYLENGGALFMARDALDSDFRIRLEQDGELLRDYLASDWGIVLREDVIVEETFAQAGQGFGLSFLAANFGSSPITGNDLDRFGLLFNIARSIAWNDEVIEVSRINLVTTSDQAWGETDFEGLVNGFAEPNEGEDVVGNLTIAVSGENGSTGGRVVVVGDTDLFLNSLILQNGNGLFFSNALNWLADDELAVELTPRENIDRQLTIAQNQLNLILLATICLGPGLAGVVGLIVWYSRRQRR